MASVRSYVYVLYLCRFNQHYSNSKQSCKWYIVQLHIERLKRRKTNGHGVELKTDRLALLDARGAGTLDGGAVAALWLPAPDLVCGSRCNQ